MYISQENPIVKGNNFESNRARAEAERLGQSVANSPAVNLSSMDQESPEKEKNNPLHIMDADTQEGKTTTAEAATIE